MLSLFKKFAYCRCHSYAFMHEEAYYPKTINFNDIKDKINNSEKSKGKELVNLQTGVTLVADGEKPSHSWICKWCRVVHHTPV